jgi:methionine-rich copper-binding protein CopC
MKSLVPGSIVVSTLLLAASAQAHAKLLSASPPVGGEVQGPPSEIRITFSESIYPNFSGIVVKDQAGHVEPVGPSRAEGDKKVLVTPLKAKLAPGRYQVAWHAVCADTHRMQGEYAFTVR